MSGKLRILVTGKTGQLARSLQGLCETAPDLELQFAGRQELDIADPVACRALVDAVRPDLVLNTAAYTGVDAAEHHRDGAYAVNAAGAANLAIASAARGVPIIHVSTDYVFDGTTSSAYDETNDTKPLNVYGSSKLEGERLVCQLNPQHIIVRTAWLYSPFGQNFVSWLLTAAKRQPLLNIVADQVGNPTSTFDLAKALLALSRRLGRSDWSGLSGVYHLAGPQPMSRYEWAHMIIGLSRKMSGPACPVRAAVTTDFPTPAVRPLRTVLNTSRFQEEFGLDFPPPEKSIGDALEALLRPRKGVS